ncbi:uncharacterized protein [Coffea arabica]|uniref:Uncharacterized protein n=1 Tax=Coffea arabica TaxID=13443 RepID=A0A6P6V790_COFAR|nr:probable leucine-rich repeat receptor-like protein kinase At1g35710 [Coffea arabica]
MKDLRWIVGLSSLEGLVLSGVNLSAVEVGLQTINMLPSLTRLELVGCGLFMNPHLSQVNFTSLSSLELGENNFNNYMVPPWLHNLTGLHDLGLSSNHLSGPIHGLFEQMTSLVDLNLGENLFDASTLKSLCNVSSLNYLDLSLNDMQGSIPSEIGQLSKLQVLDVSSNSLTGVLSEDHFAKLGELKSLNQSENLFALNVSSWWVPRFQLRDIMMSSIKVGLLFPAWLRTEKEVQWLDMQNASISDSIPSWFGVFCYEIYFVDFFNNNLTWNLLEFKQMKKSPPDGNSPSTVLKSNKLDGSLKSFPSYIYELDLSQNFLTGHIPLPDVGQTVASTIFLILSDNHFTSSIPEDLCKLENLKYLDLSNNFLSGRVPLCLGNLPDLLVLNLANNSLCGQIPSSLGNLGQLWILHLN